MIQKRGVRRRIAIGVALVIVVLAVAAVLVRTGYQTVPPRQTAERRGALLAAAASQPTHPHAGPSSAVGAPTATTIRPGAQAATPVGSPSILGGLAHTAAEEYRRRAQYPRWSIPIDEKGEDPILRDREVSPNIARGPNGEEPSLVCFPDQVSFETPDPVIVYAYVSMNGTPVAVSGIDAEIRNQDGNMLARLQFNDDGREGDPQAGDGIYAATLHPENIATRLNGPYAVRVHAVTADGAERFGATGFLYSNPDAQLTGHYVDDIVDGNLRIDAEVQVSAAGRFHLEASLYTQDGRPVAWAQNALQLDVGTHTIALSFFGRIFRQQSVNGPYVLRFVALSTTTRMPNAKNRLVENVYVTRAYAADAFSDQPFNDPNLLDAANRLEGGAAPR